MTQELIRFVTAGDTSFGLVRENDTTVRVGISGNLIFSNRDQLKQLVVDQLERGDRWFVLDCTRCAYIDAVGCGVLVSLNSKIKKAGGELVIEGLNEDLQMLFELTKLDTIFAIRRTNDDYDDEDDTHGR